MDEVEKNPEDLILLPFDERAPLNTMEPTNPAGGSAVAGADSQLSSPEFAKPGQVLRLNEVALQNIDERALFLPLLRLEYGISFAPNILQGSTSISFTSRKSILSAESGDRFFLKEKPLYCCAKSRLKLSADFQNYLASNLDFVTPLIRTISGEDYVRIGTRTFFLTRYTSGSIFSGRALQSLSCAES